MTEQLTDIGRRLLALRGIQDVSAEDFCASLSVSREDLDAYERGEKDFSFSFLYNAAQLLGVDVMDLISGDSPRLSSYCLVRQGEGYHVDRRAAYHYSHLAFTFRDKKAEPFLVTVEPKEEDPVLHEHKGQEFMYVIEGSLRFFIGTQSFDLIPGDSMYFNSGLPHAMKAHGGQSARFIAVVMG